MKFIQIGNNFLINVSKIDFICFRDNLVEIYIGTDLYYFSANQDDYNNIANFINGDSNFLQINTMATIYSTDKSNTFRKRGWYYYGVNKS